VLSFIDRAETLVFAHLERKRIANAAVVEKSATWQALRRIEILFSG